jgi:hypothetical protein
MQSVHAPAALSAVSRTFSVSEVANERFMRVPAPSLPR